LTTRLTTINNGVLVNYTNFTIKINSTKNFYKNRENLKMTIEMRQTE